MHCAKFRLVEASIGTCSFPYWHAFGVDDAAISHKQSLARAKWCSRCGSLFLSTNGSFFVIAEVYWAGCPEQPPPTPHSLAVFGYFGSSALGESTRPKPRLCRSFRMRLVFG